MATDPNWMAGWYLHAKQTRAHPGRVGGFITPKGVVVHTTDMHPSEHDALVHAWQTRASDGACAHFLIGRTPEQGVKQFVSIGNNANHAGGKIHGWYTSAYSAKAHPNAITIGIELDCAGLLRRDRTGGWLHPDSNKPIPDDEVYLESRGSSPPRGWHKLTAYQYGALRTLLTDLDSQLLGFGTGVRVQPDGDYQANGVPWAAMPTPRVVGHVTLDPVNKTDPGPEVMAWIKANT